MTQRMCNMSACPRFLVSKGLQSQGPQGFTPSVPARGSKAWKTIYKRRTAVERVIAYLKEFFQLNNIQFRTGERAQVHFDLAHLLYNGAELACDRLTERLLEQVA